MTRKTADKFLNDLRYAIIFESLSGDVNICDYISFNSAFPISQTYSTTLCLGNGVYVCIDIDESRLQIFNTNKLYDWYKTYSLISYNKIELTLKVYKEFLKKYK